MHVCIIIIITREKCLQPLQWGIWQISLSFTCSMVMILHSLSHTQIHTVLSAACLNVHQRVWHCCPGLILISFKNKAASAQLHQELQTSDTIHWLLTRVHGPYLDFQIMSVLSKMVQVIFCWIPSLYRAYHLHSQRRQISDESVCISNHLLRCVSGRGMFGFCTTSHAACWSRVRWSLSQLPSAQI